MRLIWSAFLTWGFLGLRQVVGALPEVGLSSSLKIRGGSIPRNRKGRDRIISGFTKSTALNFSGGARDREYDKLSRDRLYGELAEEKRFGRFNVLIFFFASVNFPLDIALHPTS